MLKLRNTAVIDFSPLISLKQIDGIHLLNSFDQIIIPSSVKSSFEEIENNLDKQLSCLNNYFILAPTPSKIDLFIRNHLMDDLHFKDREILFLADYFKCKSIITDDYQLRESSVIKNLPISTLGVIFYAFKTRNISLDEAKSFIKNLKYVSDMFASDAILEIALKYLINSSVKRI